MNANILISLGSMLHYNLPIIDFDQAGSVYMLNLTTVLHLQKDLILTEMEHNAVFEGDQSFARFGWDVGLMDINEDGIKDLLFSSPFRTNDITEEIRGGINHGQISTGESFNFFLPLKSSPSLVEQSRLGSSFIGVPATDYSAISLVISSPRSFSRAFHGGSVHILHPSRNSK
ncbi:phosphatidylinositol-glycan-specific phospholipase D-like isoform X4 [Acropora millepora]|uniref:phosphatidylinositol-glycan-specific phospholipase D-like isoform X4 n=1 Tax=Acropora millepora TaxID=45264 RepID=UPI001CF5DAB8|nr:phosphatidylinositol-glycan-specific phospholipase D-like isoform X4 [Acropora millepora]